MEYIDCPWFIDFLLQEVAQLSANREKFVSAICFGTFEADNFRAHCAHSFFFVCVSIRHVFAVCVHVDLCVGGAAVSADGYNEKEEKEEELETEGKIEREREGGVERQSARQRGGFGLPGTHSSSRQQSVSGGPLIQSAAASAREAPG